MGSGRVLRGSLFFLFLPLSAFAWAQAIEVLYLSDLAADSPETTVVVDAFKRGVQASGRHVEVFLEALDEPRFTMTPERRAELIRRLEGRYGGLRFDIILAQANVSLGIAVAYRDAHAPETPVYCFDLILPYQLARYSGARGVYGRILSDPVSPTLHLASRLLPKARRAYLVTSLGPEMERSFSDALYTLRDELPRLELAPVVTDDYVDVAKALSSAGPDAFVLLLDGGWRLPGGDILSGTNMVDHVASTTHLPCFGILDSSFGTGLVGGALIDREAMGREASEMTLAILFGDPKPLPWLASRSSVPTVDFRALKRLGIPASRLPAGTRVLFAPPDIWIQYEIPLKAAAVFVLVALAALLIVVIVRRRELVLLTASTLRLERSVAERTEELQTANNELEASNSNLAESLRRIESMQETIVEDTRDAVLGRLALGLAHEINTPLAVIQTTMHSTRMVLSEDAKSLPNLLMGMDGARFELLHRLLASGPTRDETRRNPASPSRERRALLQGRMGNFDVKDDQVLLDLFLETGLDALPDAELRALCLPENRSVLEFLYLASVLDSGTKTASVAAQRIARVVETVRSYARDNPRRLAGGSSSLGESIDRALFLYREDTAKGVTVSTELAADLPRVRISEPQLIRIWSALVECALQSMGGAGEIRIGAWREGDWALVELRDSGPGIEPAARERLFAPFSAPEDSQENLELRLGLSLSQRIVEGAGGTIEYVERDGRMVFLVRLPAKESQYGE